jgi:exopolysaccharide biosynthesis polyprenyl glycosylphosphotransferase
MAARLFYVRVMNTGCGSQTSLASAWPAGGGRVALTNQGISSRAQDDRIVPPLRPGSVSWMRTYLRRAGMVDCFCALVAGFIAFDARFGDTTDGNIAYFWLSITLPILWLSTLSLAGAYDSRFIGVGSDEFRRVLNAGICLTAVVAIVAYATKTDVARGYVVVAIPCLTMFGLLGRFRLRKRLHRQRGRNMHMRRVVAVGHPDVIKELVAVLRRETHHGLSVVAACVVGPDQPPVVGDIPVTGGLGNISHVVRTSEADTVAVLACPEMSSARLRDLAWELEKTGTDLCVAPALLDVAGPRTTIRPTAGLPLLHLDHPEFTGARWLIKELFDRTLALTVLLLLLPVLVVLALAIRLDDGGPALFRQTRVGKDGQPFTLYKFRTMVMDAERRKADLNEFNESDGVLFKIRNDPRVTSAGRWLRRHSLDELPQLFNVLKGDMSLVGPRPALPAEVDEYGDHMRRRLRVKPGITGLWQVNGRSDLSWEEAVRLDVRYVENWSFVLDLQILWKTGSTVINGAGAY